MFPRLDEFIYSYHGNSWDEIKHLLFKALPFFQTPEVVPQLRVIKLHLTFDGLPSGYSDDLWVGRSNTIATHPSWAELDAALAKGYFPALEKVYISLSFCITILSLTRMINDSMVEQVADKEGLKREVEDGVMKSFSASLKAMVPLEIIVCMDF